MRRGSGLRQNAAQFGLLVVVNAFVGAMVGLERTLLPALAEQEFELAARSAILSFIVVFGLTKAGTNYVAGRLSDRFGRRPTLLAGWVVALPVPLVLAFAPSWGWVIAANVLLGISQGLTWSTTVVMKIDLAGPRQRGLAMGLNEFAGYLAVAGSALATGYLAARMGLRDPLLLGVGFAFAGLGLSLFARETRGLVQRDASAVAAPTASHVFVTTSFVEPNLASACQAGLVNNLNDGLAWGLFPLMFAAAGLSLGEIGVVAAIYPAVWGLGQLVTGPASDRLGRKGLIVWGMWVQGGGLLIVLFGQTLPAFAFGAAVLGAGTAMVYPTLLAAVSDAADPSWRATAVGIYRLWRDSGYAVGAVLAGVIADAFGVSAAVASVAALTFASGVLVAVRMRPVTSDSAGAPTGLAPSSRSR